MRRKLVTGDGGFFCQIFHMNWLIRHIIYITIDEKGEEENNEKLR